jgi:hypothetical protein
VSLAAIKRSVVAGQVYDVTNHYITRVDHPAYGTTRRTVARVTGSSVYMAAAGGEVPPWPAFKWPRASQVAARPGGVILLYGGGAGQQPDELFLALTPVQP